MRPTGNIKRLEKELRQARQLIHCRSEWGEEGQSREECFELAHGYCFGSA